MSRHENSRASMMLKIRNLDLAASVMECENYRCPIDKEPTEWDSKGHYFYPSWCTAYGTYDVWSGEHDVECDGCKFDCACTTKMTMDMVGKRVGTYRVLKKKRDIARVALWLEDELYG